MRNTGDVFSPVAGDNWPPEEVARLVEPRLSSQACALSSHAMEETGGGRLRYQRHTGWCRAVVRIGGDLDLAIAPHLCEEIVTLASRGVSAVTVDLAHLDFIDSSGLTALITG